MSQLAAHREDHVDTSVNQPGGLFALALAGHDYAFLHASYPLIASGQATSDLIMLMIRSLVKLGLGGPARELLQYARQCELTIDYEAVRAMLVPLPIGRVPWQELQATYESNRNALLTAQPELASALDAIATAARTQQLFRTLDGTYLLSQPQPTSVRAWNPGFIDPAVIAQAPIPEPKPGSPTLVVGLGSNAMLQRIIETTATQPSEAGVLLLVVEDDPGRAFAALSTLDLAPLLAAGRVRLFLGEHAADQLACFLAAQPDVDLPSGAATMQWCEALSDTVSNIVSSERTRRDQEFLDIGKRLRTRAAQRSTHDHAARLAPGATILGFTSRFTTMLQYSMRDIGAALKEHGYNFVLMREEDAQRTHSSLTIARAIEQHDPALTVMINHFRRERADAMIGVPVLSWIQDPTPVCLSRETGESIGELDFVCGYYVERCTQELGYPAERFVSLCLPASTHFFHDAPLDDDDNKLYGCDIMYVGHRHADADTHVQTWRNNTPTRLHPLFDRLLAAVEKMIDAGRPLTNTHELVAHSAQQLKLDLPTEHVDRIATHYLTRLHDILYRTQTLSWIARWSHRTGRTFKIYGKGWDTVPALQPFAMGPIEHGEPLRKAYRGAKIVLQTLPAGFMHQRTFEGLCSGSLVLARHAPTSSADQHFAELDRVIFHREDDLIELCERYLGDHALRAMVTHEMREIVLREFTYSATMPKLIEHVRTQLGASESSGHGA